MDKSLIALVEYRNHEALTIPDSAAVALTPAKLISEQLRAVRVKITLESGTLRYWENGTDPTTSVGQKWAAASGPLLIDGRANVQGLRLISTSGSLSAMVSYGF